MSVALRPISLPEFSLRVATRPARGDWFVLVTPPHQLAGTQETLAADVEAFTEGAPKVTSLVESSRDLVRAIRTPTDGVVLVGGLESFSDVEWRSVDLMRSRLEGAGTVVLLMSPKQLNLLAGSAPNLASWLTGGIWRLDEDIEQLSEAERADRLKRLQTSTAMSDEDIIKGAQNGTLSREPQFTEWLLLLGRSDLIERR
jgi:hypothetical protein